MINDFDEAVLCKIQNWYKNTIFANTAIMYNSIYQLSEDAGNSKQISFPMINIYRPSGMSLVEGLNTSASSLRGIPYHQAYINGEPTNKIRSVRKMHVSLIYQLDIYAKSPEEVNTITENIMMALMLDPFVEVIQEDKGNVIDVIDNKKVYSKISERYELMYNNGPTDQSDFSNNDRIYMSSISYEIKTAGISNFRTVGVIEDTNVDLEVDKIGETE